MDDHSRDVAQIKGDADNQMFRKIELGIQAGKTIWGFGAILVIGTIWLVRLSVQVAANAAYVEKEGQEPGMFQRMHDSEELGRRRDNQIRALWKHDFGEDPF